MLPATERLNLEGWNTYAQHRLSAGEPMRTEPPSLSWTPWPGTGPGVDLLGDIAGRRVVELGCGAGNNAVALAAAGATVTAVDRAPAMIQRAVRRWGHPPGLDWTIADASAYLARSPEAIDTVCSIFGSLTFSSPPRLLPLIAARLRSNGTLAFSTREPSDRRPCIRRRTTLPTTGRGATVVQWLYDPTSWRRMLDQAGFERITIRQVTGTDTAPPGGACLIVTAHLRPPR